MINLTGRKRPDIGLANQADYYFIYIDDAGPVITTESLAEKPLYIYEVSEDCWCGAERDKAKEEMQVVVTGYGDRKIHLNGIESKRHNSPFRLSGSNPTWTENFPKTKSGVSGDTPGATKQENQHFYSDLNYSAEKITFFLKKGMELLFTAVSGPETNNKIDTAAGSCVSANAGFTHVAMVPLDMEIDIMNKNKAKV